LNTSAEAASGNSIDTVKQLIKGDQSLENVKIGESIKVPLQQNMQLYLPLVAFS
jgi:hypothetical protein